MLMHPRLYRLIEAHDRIDLKLRHELTSPRPDSWRLIQLKKLKLRAKQLIHRFTRTRTRASA
jgi:hypothetical protein